MDVERALISKIIDTGRLEDAIAAGVREDLFYDDECRDMYRYLSDHMRRYKSRPSVAAVKSDHPDFEWEFHEDALEYLIDKFVVLCKRRLARDMVVELAAACDDPERAANIDLDFLEVSRKLATLVPSTKVARFSDMPKRVIGYEQDVEKGVQPGIPFGFPWLDDKTGGLQPHEVCTIAAFSGIGKSTLSMVIAFHAWANGKTPLIISLEMEARMMLRKFDAMAGNLDYKKLKQLQLPDEQIERWRQKAEEVALSIADIPIIDSIRHCTPDHVFAETVRHKPDLVVIDYITLMRSSRPGQKGASMWQSVTEITQDLKQNARTLKIPIIAMAQTNRGSAKDGADLDNVGYSLSIVQDSDIVIGMFADDAMKENKEMQIRLKKNRDGGLGEFMARWDHDNMDFRQKGYMEGMTRQHEQDPEPAAEPPHSNPVAKLGQGVVDLAQFKSTKRPTPRKRPGG